MPREPRGGFRPLVLCLMKPWPIVRRLLRPIEGTSRGPAPGDTEQAERGGIATWIDAAQPLRNAH